MSFTQDSYDQILTLYLIPGMKVKLEIAFDHTDNKGLRPIDGGNITYDGKQLLNGFLMMDETVGKLEKTEDIEVAVYYTHQKSEPNDIVFFSDRVNAQGGILKVCFRVASIPIHDHSSIVQGGPAYGTYFSDNEVD